MTVITLESTISAQVINHMRTESKVNEGTRIAILLTKEAAWYNGATPAPTHNMEGYEKFDSQYHYDNDKRDGFVVMGTIKYFNEKGNRIVLASSAPSILPDRGTLLPHDLGVFYVEGDVIRDYEIINFK